MPKILHLPLNVPGSEQVGQERGFRQVFGDPNYKQFDYLFMQGDQGKQATNDALLSVIAEFKPDIVWAQLQETDVITAGTWEVIHKTYPHIHLTTWSGDAREYIPAGMQQWLPHFDIFYNDTDQVDLYKPYCKRYEFMPIAVDPEEATDYSHPTPKIPDIIFIGNDYGETFSNGPFRKELMMALTREFGDRFGVFGTGWNQSEVNVLGACPVKHQGAYYNKAKVVISVDHIKDIMHWSERLVWAMASGTPVLMEKQRGEFYKYLDSNVSWFVGTNECIAKVHNLLMLDDNAREIRGNQAREYVFANHIWSKRAEQVLADWGKIKS